MTDEEDIKLPKANLITAMNGGDDSLKSMVDDNSSERFNGYIKVTIKVGTIPANGILVILSGNASMAYFHHHNDKALGHEALLKIFDVSKSRKCVLKLYSFPSDAKEELSTTADKYPNTRVDIDAFWKEVAKPGTATSSVPGSGETTGIMARPRVDDVMEGAGDAFKVIVGEGMVVVDEDDEKEAGPIDDQKIDKVEEALKGREEQIRKEIERKLVEREELKMEEEKFLKMDEVFSKLLKEREEEIKKKEADFDNLETQLKGELEKKEKLIEHREEEVQKEMGHLQSEQEEMKLREKKLQEMEKMFRRVLANTEDRLKKKEDELILKEEELKHEVAERMKLIEDLKLREARVLEMEQQISASATGDEMVTDEMRQHEEKIKVLEEGLRTAKEELDKTCKEIDEHKGVNEDIKRCLKVLDDLLGKLPDDIIEEFSISEGYELYEKIMRHFKLVED